MEEQRSPTSPDSQVENVEVKAEKGIRKDEESGKGEEPAKGEEHGKEKESGKKRVPEKEGESSMEEESGKQREPREEGESSMEEESGKQREPREEGESSMEEESGKQREPRGKKESSMEEESGKKREPREEGESSMEKESGEQREHRGKEESSMEEESGKKREPIKEDGESLMEEESGKEKEFRRGEQRSTHIRALNFCRVDLVQSIHCVIEPILDQMIQDDVIADEVYRNIRSMKSPNEQGRKLLEYLSTGSRRAYVSLKRGLQRVKLPHIVEMLEEAEKLPAQIPMDQPTVKREPVTTACQASELTDPETIEHPLQRQGSVTNISYNINKAIIQNVHDLSGLPAGGTLATLTPKANHGGNHRRAPPDAVEDRAIGYIPGSKTSQNTDCQTEKHRGSPRPDIARCGRTDMGTNGSESPPTKIPMTDETCMMQAVDGAASATSQQETTRPPQGNVAQGVVTSRITSPTPTEHVNLLLVGCKGNGKSSTANTILGKDIFAVSTWEGGTEKHQTDEISVGPAPWNKDTEIKVIVTDTPGVSKEMTESEFNELESAAKESQQGFDAIVLMWSANTVRNEEEEENVFKSLHRMFGNSLYNHLVIIVTGVRQNVIPKYCKRLPESLRHIKEKCHTILGIDNNRKEENGESIWELIQSSQQIRRKWGRYKEEHLSKECQALPLGDELRIALVGVTGAGKSSTANNIVGEEKFKASSGASSKTKECSYEKRKKGDREIAVVDTPGVWDTHDSMGDICEEISRITTIFSAGLHALLLVVPVGRFTEQDVKVVEILKEIFGEAFMKYVVIVLTYKDKIVNDKELKGDVAKFILTVPQTLQNLLKECKGRYVAFDNTAKDETVKRMQLTELVRLVDEMVRGNGGVPFRDGTFQEGQHEKDKIIKEIMMGRQEVHNPPCNHEEVDEGYIAKFKKEFKRAAAVLTQIHQLQKTPSVPTATVVGSTVQSSSNSATAVHVNVLTGTTPAEPVPVPPSTVSAKPAPVPHSTIPAKPVPVTPSTINKVPVDVPTSTTYTATVPVHEPSSTINAVPIPAPPSTATSVHVHVLPSTTPAEPVQAPPSTITTVAVSTAPDKPLNVRPKLSPEEEKNVEESARKEATTRSFKHTPLYKRIWKKVKGFLGKLKFW